MRLCFVTKYPPIQGGTCATTYWLAYGLAERGHQVFVVTNSAEVEDDYRLRLSEDDRAWLQPVFEASGGFVKVFQAERFHRAKMQHIPCANPYVSKLAATATQVVRSYDCELIFAFYYEPYAVAGYLASRWTGRPLAIRHAGSDLDRLMKAPGLATTYKEILKAADGVLTWINLAHRFLGMGVAPSKIYMGMAGGMRKEVFRPEAPPLDLRQLVAEVGWSAIAEAGGAAPELDPSRPTIGIYGKVGEPKGSFDLVESLSLLREEGCDFNFVALTQGRELSRLKDLVRRRAVADRTWILPFIAHWRIPGFIRACTAVCFLERGFPIKIHTPKVASEILACGTCLVLSGEIAAKQGYREELVDQKNVLLVADPRDHAELACALRFVLENPERARDIGRSGHSLIPEKDRHAGFIDLSEALFRRILGEASPTRTFEEIIAEEQRRLDGGATPFPFVTRYHEGLMPWMRHFFPEHLDAWRSEFFASRGETAVADRNVFAVARDFCDWIAGKAEAVVSPDLLPFLGDILRFQKARLGTFHEAAEDSALPFESADQLESIRAIPEGALPLKPSRSRYSVIQELGWDIPAFFDEILPGLAVGFATPDHPSPDELLSQARAAADDTRTTVFSYRTQNFTGGTMKLAPAAKKLLELCDGSRTTSAVLDEIWSGYEESGTPREHIEAGVFGTLKTFYRNGALIFT